MSTRASVGDDHTSLFALVGRNAWRLVGIVLAAAVVFWALVHLRLVVLPLIAAGFAAAVLSPPVRWLRGRGLPPMAATWVVLVVALGAFALLVTLLAPSIADQFDDLGQDVKEGVDRVVDWLATGPLEISEQQIDDALASASDSFTKNQGQLAAGVLAGVTLVGEVIAGLLLTIALVFFFLKDGPKIAEWLTELAPQRHRKHARELGRRLNTTISAYMRGVAIIGFVDATLIGIVLLVVGVPLVLPLMVLTFFAAFLPLVGAVLAGIVATLVALVSNGVTQALIVGASIIVIQQVEGDVLQPVVMGRSVRIHPVVVLVALTAGAAIGGFIGAFLAVPIAAVVASWSGYLRGVAGNEPVVPAE